MVEETKQSTKVEKKNIKKYQWIKGDKTTQVVQVAEDQQDGKWLYFTDGSRINPNLVKEYLMEVPPNTPVGTVINPNVLNTNVEVVNQVQTPEAQVTVAPENVKVKEPSIMGKMITKMSKKNVVTVPIQININIPTPDLYNMLSGGMEEEDLNEEIMEVALSQIEINKLQEYIKANVTQFLSEYYS